MYSIEWAKIFGRSSKLESQSSPLQPGKTRLISGTVWALGFTSLLTDISSEMVTSVLPIYLATFLGLGPIALGWIDGVQQGGAALVRLFGGFLADRWRRHKEVAVFGYGLSAICRILLLLAGSAWTSILAIAALDRVGKGIRTAPRDALISQSSPPALLATAFGVHRSLDGVGAMLGPLIAFGILLLLPGAFDVLFVASFGVALIGLGVILTFVRNAPGGVSTSRTSLRVIPELCRNTTFRSQVIAGSLLGLATISDSFVFLILQRKFSMPVTVFPLLFVGAFLFTALFATPCGRVADRFGRIRVLLSGYVILGVLYTILLAVSGLGSFALVLASLCLLGLYYAATDGVLTAMAAAVLPASQSGTGLALLATAVNIARLVASVGFGYAWTYLGLGQATLVFLVFLLLAVICATLILARARLNSPVPV